MKYGLLNLHENNAMLPTKLKTINMKVTIGKCSKKNSLFKCNGNCTQQDPINKLAEKTKLMRLF